MKCYVFLMVFCILSIGGASVVSAIGISDGIVTDTNEFEYSYVGDGIYSISSDTTTSQFGFAISGNYNGQPIIRSFNDLTWANPVKTNLQDGFKYNIVDTSDNWDTQFTFTDDYTKIQNTITNNYPNDITNAKFWYVMGVNPGDEIKIATKKYTVTPNSNIHITDSQHDLNTLTQKMRVNNIQLNYADLIDNGFDITDLYLTDGDVLGYPNQQIIAVGFTKGNSVFTSGSTIVIDPAIENGLDAVTTYIGTEVVGNFTLNFNEVNASSVNVTISNITGAFTKYKTITFTNPPTVNNYQARFTVTYDSDMNADFSDLRFNDLSGNPLYYNIYDYTASTSATVDVLIPSQESSINMVYDNAGASDASDPDNVYLSYFTGDSTGWTEVDPSSHITFQNNRLEYSGVTRQEDTYVYQSESISGNWIIETTASLSSMDTSAHVFVGGGVSSVINDLYGHSGNSIGIDAFYNIVGGHALYLWEVDTGTPTFSTDFYTKPATLYITAYRDGNTVTYEVYSDSARTTLVKSIQKTVSVDNFNYAYLFSSLNAGGSEAASGWVDDFYVRKYLSTAPTANFGSEQSLPGGGNVTVSVIGDSYVFTETGTTTLNPTADISNVTFVANSTTKYDYNLSIYWTEDFAVYTETVSGGYANYSVSYAPAENVTSGTINATYNLITFSEHDYIGSISASLDGNPISATLNGQTVSIAVTDLNTSTHSIFISVPYNPQPTMIYPNGQTLSFPFPPLNHDVPANWSTTTGTYRYTVTTQGGVFVAQDTVFTNSTTFSLAAGDYYWYIQGYDDVFDEYSSASTVYNFIVENDYGVLNTTAIVGIVYSQDEHTKTPITNAVVTITNNTWSDSVVVGADGFYSFLDLAGNETYFLQATAEYFDDSGAVVVTTLLNNVTQRDILLTTTTTDYVPHFVKFVVKDIFGNKFSGVTSDVYKGSTVDTVAFRTGTTGVDGSVTFRLDQNIQYTLTFIKADESINEILTVYPKNDFYNVYTIRTIVPDDEYSSDLVEVGITKSIIDNTNAYINVSYNDSLAQTTQLTVYLNQSTSDDIQNQTVIDSWSGVTQSENISFTVSDYTGQSYFVNVISEHSELGTIQRSYAVTFGGMADDKGFSSLWVWLAIGSIMFTGLLFKATNAQTGAVVVCGVSWAVLLLGWLDNLGSKFSLAITAGLILATVLSIAAVMAKGRKEG